MTQKSNRFFFVPYIMWILLFVLIPLGLIVYQSFFDIQGTPTFLNFTTYFSSSTYIKMTINSFFYASFITFLTLLISYPTAYFLTKTKWSRLWLLLLILPTWMNILLKAYAFIGLFSQSGVVNQFLEIVGIGRQQLLFTNTSFLIVATYIEIPFMVLPIYNAIDDISPSYFHASQDLGANSWETFRRVVFPMSLSGVKSAIQAVFIPSLSLFMLTRLIGGNRVITLGTAIEQHFLVTQNWGMGSTIGVVLVFFMIAIMVATRERMKGEKTK